MLRTVNKSKVAMEARGLAPCIIYSLPLRTVSIGAHGGAKLCEAPRFNSFQEDGFRTPRSFMRVDASGFASLPNAPQALNGSGELRFHSQRPYHECALDRWGCRTPRRCSQKRAAQLWRAACCRRRAIARWRHEHAAWPQARVSTVRAENPALAAKRVSGQIRAFRGFS
jgi:hypothetical protein